MTPLGTAVARYGVLALVVVALAFLPAVTNSYWVGVAFGILSWIALAESWVMLSGLAGYISLGHAVFVGLGAYVMALSWMVLPMEAAIPLAGLAAGVLAFVVGYPCLRVRGPYFVILTFGLAEFVKFVVVNVEAGLGKAGRLLFGAPGLETLYPIMLGLAVAAFVMVDLTRRSRLGFGLRAIRENEEAAETLGVGVTRLKILALVASAIIPGAVGAVLVLRTTYFEPLQVFSPLVSFTIVTMAVIGGGDRPAGPLLGVLFLAILQEALWARAPQVYMIILGVTLIAFVLFAPDGLHGRLSALLRRAR